MPPVTSDSAIPQLSFRLPLEPARLQRARERIRDYLYGQSVIPEVTDDVVLAIEEAMTNAVRHSGATEDLEVVLHFRGADLVAHVRDRGRGFDPAMFDPARPPDPSALDGRGLYMMAQLMDDLQLRRDGGLVVRAVKRGARAQAARPAPGETPWVVPGEHLYGDARRRALLDEIDESFIALDWEYRCVHVNEAALGFAQRSRDEVLGARLWDLWPELRATPLGEAVRQAMELGKFSVVEFRNAAPDHWVEARIYPTSTGVSIFAHEIDERKRTERERDQLAAAARESEQRFSAMFEETPFAISLTRMPEGITVSVNPAFERLFGYSRDEAIGKTSLDLGISDEASRARVAAELASTGRARDFECVRTTRSGERVVLSLSIDPVDIGGVQHALTTIRDITAAKRAEEELKQSRAKLQAALESMTDAVFISDREGRFIDFNEAFATFHRFTSKEEASTVFGDYPELLDVFLADGSPAPLDMWAVPRALRGETATNQEYTLRRKDTGETWVGSYSLAPIRDEGGQIVGSVVVGRDVTDQKRLEEDLRESEERSRHLLRYAPAAIYEIDFRGPRFISVNDFMCEYSGYSREELLAANPLELLVADDRPRFQDRIRKTLAGETPGVEVEYRFVTKQGEERWAALNVIPLLEDGTPIGAFVVAHDVTELKQAEEALRESDQRFRLALRNAPISVAAQDRDLRYVWAFNQRTAPPDQIVGKLDADIFTPEEAGRLGAIKRRVLDEGVEIREEMWLDRPGGRIFLRVNFEPIRGEDGRIMGVGVATVDLTPMKLAEEALAESEERLRTVLENSLDGINMLDLATGQYVFLSPAQAEMTGFTEEELRGMTAEEADERVHPDDRRASVERQRRVAAGEDVAESVEYRWKVKSGEYRWFSDRRKVVRDDQGRPVALVGVSRDITDRKRAEEALKESEQRIRFHLENTPLAVVEWDARFVVTRWAGEAEAMFGWGAGETVGRPIMDLHMIFEDDIPAVEQTMAKLTDGRHSQVVSTNRNYTKDGRVIDCTWYNSVLFDERGEMSSVMSQVEDITQRKRTEEELRGRYEQQRDIATALQQSLLHALPALDGLEVGLVGASAYEPALIGGDFWDVFELPDKRVVVVIGDVAGKGIRAAAMTETVRSTMRAFAHVDAAPAFILRKTNEVLLGGDPGEQFVTALVAVVEPDGGGHVSIGSAGHPGPVGLLKDSCLLVEPAYGLPLGTFSGEFSSDHLQLTPGDCLVLYTDGVTEAKRGGELFGEQRLVQVVESLRGRPAQEVADRVRDAVADFAGALRDDLQIVALRLR